MIARPPRPVAWLLGSTALAGLVLRAPFGDALFLTRYTGYLMPWLLVGLVPGAAFAWAARSRALSAVLSASAAIVVAAEAPLFRSHGASFAPSAPFRVMSFNTWSENADDRGIARVVAAQRPDVLLLQEIPPDVFGRVVERLQGGREGGALQWAYAPDLMQGVISRFPVESRASLEDEGQTQEVVLRTPAGRVTVFNVHPLRTGGWRHRYREIAALLEDHVLRERGPVILAGDLNAPDASDLYALVARHLRNAHREAGAGFGFTYPSPSVRWAGFLPLPPLVRIDHVFFGDGLVAVRAGTIEDSGGSDHRPVFADLALRPDPPGGAG